MHHPVLPASQSPSASRESIPSPRRWHRSPPPTPASPPPPQTPALAAFHSVPHSASPHHLRNTSAHIPSPPCDSLPPAAEMPAVSPLYSPASSLHTPEPPSRS